MSECQVCGGLKLTIGRATKKDINLSAASCQICNVVCRGLVRVLGDEYEYEQLDLYFERPGGPLQVSLYVKEVVSRGGIEIFTEEGKRCDLLSVKIPVYS